MNASTEPKKQYYASTCGELTGPYPSAERAAQGKPARYRDGHYRATVYSADSLTDEAKANAGHVDQFGRIR